MFLLVLAACTVYIVQEWEHITIFYRTLNDFAVIQLNECMSQSEQAFLYK